MRRIVLASVLIGLSATLAAQTPQVRITELPLRPVGSGIDSGFFSGFQKEGDTYRLRNVRYSLTNGITITADEAVLTGQNVELSGHVRMMLAPRQAAEPQVRTQCSLAEKGAYDQGWLQPSGGSHYRCMQTYDPALKPIGAAWVKVEANGTIGGTLPK